MSYRKEFFKSFFQWLGILSFFTMLFLIAMAVGYVIFFLTFQEIENDVIKYIRYWCQVMISLSFVFALYETFKKWRSTKN